MFRSVFRLTVADERLTVGRARILAIVVSLAYLPTHHFGITAFWLPVMAACVACHFRLQLRCTPEVVSRLQHAPQRANKARQHIYSFLFENTAISSVGFLLASFFSKNSSNESHFIAAVFSAPHASLTTSEAIALDTFLFSLILSISLLFACGTALRRLLAQVHFRKSVDETDEDRKFAIYLYYKTRLAIEFPTLALLHILYIISLHHFLAQEFTYGALHLIASVSLPPLLFMETSLFLVRASVYFDHF